MSDNEGDNGKGGKTLSLRGSGTETSRVRQSFSHGRTKSVVVEKKRKRVVVPGQGGAVQPVVPKPAAKPKAADAPAPASTPSATPTPAPPAARPAPDVEPVVQKVTIPAAPDRAVSEPTIIEKPAPKPKPKVETPAEPAKVAAPKPAETRPAAPAAKTAGTTARGASRRGGAGGGKPAMLKPLSKDEYDRRMKALQAAKAGEGARREREEEESRRREEEREARRAELEEARRREEEEKIRAEREQAEREEKKRLEAAASARAAAAAPKTAGRDGVVNDPAAASAAAAAAESGEDRGQKRRSDDGKRQQDAPGTPRPSRGGDDRRRSGKLTISQATGDNEQGRQRSLASMRRRQERDKRKSSNSGAEREKVVRDVTIPDVITVQELANRMAERVADVIKALMRNDIMATQNQAIDADTAELLVEEFGHKVNRVSESDVETAITGAVEDNEDDLKPRAAVVTVMGHVDHGKTSVLDALRKTSVVSGEAGGITQHIGAYQIETESGHTITFLDTPGHAAFTSMRARGAQVTDIVVLVVAADDQVMPQTIEAINHAQAAEVPMIVAINKIDLPAADVQKVRTDLLQHNVIVEDLSGEVLDVEVSALKGTGLDKLVENIVLQAELLDLKANPDRAAEGAVIEAQLDVGRGPVATVLVQKGTLRNGDIFVVGEQWGRVRAMVDDKGDRVKVAGPSVPVEVLGLNGLPSAGDVLNVVKDETEAREIADYRQRKAKELQGNIGAGITLDQLLAQAKSDAAVAELPILVKSDVQGSAEAIIQAMEKLGNDEVRVRVLHSGVGAITESDVTLAEASNAPIIGFNVRANAPARTAAQQKGVEIRYYSIIYDLVDDVKAAASGLLSAEIRETFIGYAKIKEVFKITGVGKIAGCEVTEGVARRSAGVRLLRDDVVIHTGKLKTLKRFKDEVKEVQVSQECGMAFENYEDIREGDVIEIFETEEIERTL
ncbi:MAG: translation initiation factor IF-2 [Pseudomonadota bacterium]